MLRFLKHFLTKIRGLQWKLTFSYILLTLVALVVTIAMTMLVLAQTALNQYLEDFSGQLQDIRSSCLWDKLTNHAELTTLTTSDFDGFNSGQLDASYEIHSGGIDIGITEVEGYSVVVDLHGRVLASSNPHVMPLGSLLSTKLSPDGMSVVRLAKTRNEDGKPIVFLDQQHLLYGAVPFFNPHRERLGILLIVQVIPNLGQLIVILFTMLWPIIASITCVVSLVGALFGSLMSHWFV